MRRILLAIILGLTLSPVSTGLAQSTYESWQDPDAPNAQTSTEYLRAVLQQLDTLITQAENDKAADPVFLSDLRALMQRYQQVSTSRVLFDDFSDGDFLANPTWTVGAGRYFIEKGWGLRNGLDTVADTSSSDNANQGAALLATILGQALGAKTQTTGATQQKYQRTSIFSDASIANAFAVDLSLSSWVQQGRLVIGPYQGSKRNTGYRLIYTVGGGMELIAKSASGSRSIASARGPFSLENKKVHTIRWTRRTDGSMQVILDGTVVMEATDTSFRDPFAGFGMATNGGDFIIKSVEIISAQ